MKVRAGILTLSDRASKGLYQDLSGPAIRQGFLEGPAMDIFWEKTLILPDEEEIVSDTLREWCDKERLDLILTTGGTGPAPRDRTPEATRKILDFEIPGIPESMRAAVRDRVPTAALTRGIAGVRGQTLIVNLPGSPKAVRESLEVLFGFIVHLLEKVGGDEGECGGSS